MPFLFYTLHHSQPFFVFAQHAHSSAEVQVEYLNARFEIAGEDDEDVFKAYLTEVNGALLDEDRLDAGHQVALVPEDLQPFLMIYMPLAQPTLFVIDKRSHAGLVRLNISHYEKYLPAVQAIFDQQIDAEDLPDLEAHRTPHQVPEDWLQR